MKRLTAWAIKENIGLAKAQPSKRWVFKGSVLTLTCMPPKR